MAETKDEKDFERTIPLPSTVDFGLPPGFSARIDRGSLIHEVVEQKQEIARRMALAPDDSRLEYPTDVPEDYAKRELARAKAFEETYGIEYDREFTQCHDTTPPHVDVLRTPLSERRYLEHDGSKVIVPEKIQFRYGEVPFAGQFKRTVRVSTEQMISVRDERELLHEESTRTEAVTSASEDKPLEALIIQREPNVK